MTRGRPLGTPVATTKKADGGKSSALNVIIRDPTVWRDLALLAVHNETSVSEIVRDYIALGLARDAGLLSKLRQQK